jgi:ferredoxin
VAQRFDYDKCTNCGLCVEICPAGEYEMTDGKPVVASDKPLWCITCGHCMMICPEEAVVVDGLSWLDFEKIAPIPFRTDEFDRFLASRRSVRHFEGREVPRDVIERIIATTAKAPMGVPPSKVMVTVFHGRNAVRSLADKSRLELKKWVKNFSTPVGRAIMRMMIGKDMMTAMREFVIPTSREIVNAFERENRDALAYDAPACLLFHIRRDSEGPVEDCMIAATYAMLAAHVNELGSVMIGLIPPAVDNSKQMRREYGIPEKNKVVMAVIVGYPRYRFCKTIKRSFADISWVE